MQALARMTISKIMSFQVKRPPRALLISLLTAASGSAASSVPAGQIYLQKAGIPMPSIKWKLRGSTTRKITVMRYLSKVKRCTAGLSLIFGVGNL